jgi:CRISPR-associated RAMP protein (TIGR02581 family)
LGDDKMFKVLVNEFKINFKLRPDSPLSIRSGNSNALDPMLPESNFLRSSKDGIDQVVIPGSSLKGVFRSRAEKILGDRVCDIFGKSNECESKVKNGIEKRKNEISNYGREVYKIQCPACKLFGGKKIKSRIEFKDSFPEENSVITGIRYNVGIDRVKGSAIKGALFDPEVLEDGIFNVSIYMKNIFKWQLKLILSILDDMNEGCVTVGGVSSRGFGKVLISDINMEYKDYKNYSNDNFRKKYNYDDMKAILGDVNINDTELNKENLDNEWKL